MCGYIDNRIRYLDRKKLVIAAGELNAMALDGDKPTAQMQDENDNIIMDSTESNEIEMQSIVDKLKNMVIGENSLNSIKSDLKLTRDFRNKMLLNKRTDLLESFPYFFLDVDLVRKYHLVCYCLSIMQMLLYLLIFADFV